MPIGHIFRVAAYMEQTGRSELTPAQRRRCRHKLGRALAVRDVDGVRVARPYRPAPFDNKPRTGSWHTDRALVPHCVHCEEGGGGHYHCTEQRACADCVDDAQTHADNIAAGYGPWGEDTGSEYDY